jgi:hypothetical protein
MENKKPWLSKTILVNSICGLCLALSPFIPALGGISAFVQAHAVEVGVVWSVLGVGLRLITKDKISLQD